MSEFAPKPGCPMCGIVASAAHTTPHSPRSPVFPLGSTQPEVVWRDDNFTVYREKANPVSSKGHLIIAFNLHVPSIYTLVRSLLVRWDRVLIESSVIDRPPSARHSSHSRNTPSLLSPQPFNNNPLLPHYSLLLLIHPSLPNNSNHATTSFLPSTPPTQLTHQDPNNKFYIGFITPPFKDNKIPVTDHLHAHAYIAPADLLGWWRGVAYSGLAWYEVDDLIAEIRESVSNNRVKSGYESRKAPIDSVPTAGARAGFADGTETTESGLANSTPTLEDGGIPPTVGGSSSLGRPRTPTLVT